MCNDDYSLVRKAKVWYKNIKPGMIENFLKFVRQFLTHLSTKRRLQKISSHLIRLSKKNESLKDYFNQFNKDKIMVEDYSDSEAVNAFLYSIHTGSLWTRHVEKILELWYKEITRIMATTINVKDVARRQKIKTKNNS